MVSTGHQEIMMKYLDIYILKYTKIGCVHMHYLDLKHLINMHWV